VAKRKGCPGVPEGRAGSLPQFSLGKSYRGFAPLGPSLVSVDEVRDPDNLALGCDLDGEVMQQGRTCDMLFTIPEQISRLSAVCPLLPGDIIFTGTPAGIGAVRTPPRYIFPGAVLRSWVEAVGQLRNEFIAGPEYHGAEEQSHAIR
jgi:2,4-didehydro-3-deoxy-L-rhamnonate hydrolase